MDKKMEELLGRMKAAKTEEEVLAIAKEMPRTELSEEALTNVAGGTGRIELSDAQAERVAGGGHNITDAEGKKIWIELYDNGYVCGTDPYYDFAYVLESLALQGYKLDFLVDFACASWGGARDDVEAALLMSGPVFLADCYRGAHGFHWFGE